MMDEKKKLITYVEIITDWLREHGYDGLFSDYLECACTIEDLIPCGMISQDNPCYAGYRVPCDCGEGHDYHIQAQKPKEGDS